MNTITSPIVRIPARGASRQERIRGFTVIETLTVTAIAAILVGVAGPALTATVRSVQLSSASNDLLAGFFLARSEAVKRKSRAVICKSADGVTCSATGGWQQGWMVFHDADNSGTRDAGETVIGHGQALASSLRVTGNLNVARYVSYSATGVTRLVGGGFQAGTLTLCQESTSRVEARQIILSSAGRPRVQKTQVSACA